LRFQRLRADCTKGIESLQQTQVLNPYIFSTWWGKSLIFQTYNIWSNWIHSLKYLSSTALTCKDRDLKIWFCCKDLLPLYLHFPYILWQRLTTFIPSVSLYFVFCGKDLLPLYLQFPYILLQRLTTFIPSVSLYFVAKTYYLYTFSFLIFSILLILNLFLSFWNHLMKFKALSLRQTTQINEFQVGFTVWSFVGNPVYAYPVYGSAV